MYDNNLIIGDSLKIKSYGEHIGKDYFVYFENISPDLLKYKFRNRWEMEEFLYQNGIEKFDYKSSNGKVITKVWEYIPEKVETPDPQIGKYNPQAGKVYDQKAE